MPYSTSYKRSINHKMRKFAKKIICVNFLGGKCTRCGIDDIHSLEFHHINPVDKDSAISDLMTYSWNNLQIELKKCILLCSNCHGREHTDVTFYETYKEKINAMVKEGIGIEEKIDEKTLIKLVKEGKSQRTIGKLYGMSKTTVQFRIRQLLKKGLINEEETNTLQGTDSTRRCIEKVTLEMILPHLNGGESIASIANRFDISFRTAQRKARRLRQSGLWKPTEKQLSYLDSQSHRIKDI